MGTTQDANSRSGRGSDGQAGPEGAAASGAAVSRFAEIQGLQIHYREAGSGPLVVLLHGWPTSSFLWRHIIPELARTHRVCAPDLPGFGQSSKPLDRTYSFRFYGQILDGLLEHLGEKETALVVHDLGGPVGLFWAVGKPERIRALGILNTLVYPEMSWAVKLFMLGLRLPFVPELMTSEWGLRQAMYIGITDRKRVTDECLEGTVAPFRDTASRRALIKSGLDLDLRGFAILGARIGRMTCPVRMIYGERDRILPDIARTAARLKQDLPHAQITSIPNCGHFLQEDQPEVVASQLVDFLTSVPTGRSRAGGA